jgi:hypothetical protein
MDRFDDAACYGSEVYDFQNNFLDSLYILLENPWVQIANAEDTGINEEFDFIN